MPRTLRTSLTVAAIALALSACTSSGEEAETSTSEAPVITEAAPTTQAPVTEAPAEEESAATTAAAVTEVAAEDSDPQPAASASAEPTVCTPDQYSPGGVYAVAGIEADDPDGGLVARAFAGTDAPAHGVIPQDITVDTFAEDPDYPTCFVTADGSVWWEIGHPILATGGWVNASYLVSAS